MTDTFTNGALPLDPVDPNEEPRMKGKYTSYSSAAASGRRNKKAKSWAGYTVVEHQDGSFSVIEKKDDAPLADPKVEVKKQAKAKKKLKAKVKEVQTDGGTRESWLREGVERLHAQVFMSHLVEQNINTKLPHHRVSCGFPLGARPYQQGAGKGRVGECWSNENSTDGAIEMMVSPVLAEPSRVLGILAHEMCHMYLGTEVGHGAPFKDLATAIGLEGKMTATTEGQRFLDAVAPILSEMGEYPHAELIAAGKKKDTVRQIKVQCNDEECGCTFRLARKWIEKAQESEREHLSCPICQGKTTVTMPGEG